MKAVQTAEVRTRRANPMKPESLRKEAHRYDAAADRAEMRALVYRDLARRCRDEADSAEK